MTKYNRYMLGFNIGLCTEYLIRCKFSIYPVIIIVLMGIIMVLDLTNKKSDKF